MSFPAFCKTLSQNCRRREIFNGGQTLIRFDYACLARLVMCVVGALAAIVAGAKNLYNDWAQENAVNLNGLSAGEVSKALNVNSVIVPHVDGTTKIGDNAAQKNTTSYKDSPLWNNANKAQQLVDQLNAVDGVDYKRDVVKDAPPEVREAIRGYQNGQGSLPATSEEALSDSACRELDYSKSYLHDFNEKVAGICNSSPEMRFVCYVAAFLEFIGELPNGTVLNVDGAHNLKVVCDGGREYVFDKDGKVIPDGINEGTFNINDPEEWFAHFKNDMIAAIQKLPGKSSLTKEECIKC